VIALSQKATTHQQPLFRRAVQGSSARCKMRAHQGKPCKAKCSSVNRPGTPVFGPYHHDLSNFSAPETTTPEDTEAVDGK
jgi:hypothetical protein